MELDASIEPTLGPYEVYTDNWFNQKAGSALEEAKADISGLFALQHLVDKGALDKSLERTMYVTFLASAFRSIRFGTARHTAREWRCSSTRCSTRGRWAWRRTAPSRWCRTR